MAQLTAAEKAKEEAKAARGAKRGTKKISGSAAVATNGSGNDAVNLLESMYHEGWSHLVCMSNRGETNIIGLQGRVNSRARQLHRQMERRHLLMGRKNLARRRAVNQAAQIRRKLRRSGYRWWVIWVSSRVPLRNGQL